MIKLYNFLIRKKEILKPIRKDWVGLYTCGPTVYNFAHIGNLRTYIFEDVLRRALEYEGFRVRHVMNLTDVDDKIIRDASSLGKNIFEFVKPYETAFFEDLQKLNIEHAWKYPKATEHIWEMVALVQKLLRKGMAYQQDGSVYFNISKFKRYGKLNRLNLKGMKAGVRIDADEYVKQDVKDFALWKAKKSNEPSWKTPFGEGHPGWHIECSAMSMKYLGATFDIHTGGIDNMFPHHENEIAQSEGATGKQFVKFFVEGEHLLVNDEKMSKSLGNVFTLRDVETRGFNPLAFRYLVLGAHYRSKLNFTWESLEAAQNSLERLYDFIKFLQHKRDRVLNSVHRTKYGALQKEFISALSNDLDTPRVFAIIWNLIHQYNKNPRSFNAQAVLGLLYDFDKVLGLRLKEIKPEVIPPKILVLAKKREELRKEKKWKEADKIRKEILSLDYSVEDIIEGSRISRIKNSVPL